MWRVNITCDGEVWKRYGAEFKIIAGNYQSKLIGSNKMPDGTCIMSYKIEDVSDAEDLQEKCANFPCFTSILRLYNHEETNDFDIIHLLLVDNQFYNLLTP
jgi:hypothetical protein